MPSCCSTSPSVSAPACSSAQFAIFCNTSTRLNALSEPFNRLLFVAMQTPLSAAMGRQTTQPPLQNALTAPDYLRISGEQRYCSVPASEHYNKYQHASTSILYRKYRAC